jgi:hypothetical protein
MEISEGHNFLEVLDGKVGFVILMVDQVAGVEATLWSTHRHCHRSRLET